MDEVPLPMAGRGQRPHVRYVFIYGGIAEENVSPLLVILFRRQRSYKGARDPRFEASPSSPLI